MAFIRSISGLRATLGDGLKPCMLAQYASSFAHIIPNKKVVVGRDGRPSGKWIENLITGALIASGCEVRQIGMAPTPTVQLEVEHSDAGGGIAITASHNPGEWNGLKFINSSGIFLDADENQTLWNLVDDFKNIQLPDEHFFFDIIHDYEALHRHIKKITELDFISKNLEHIKSKRYKVVVDAVNSSGSNIVPELLRQFGCEVVDIHCDSSGIFPHTPEPLPENLNDLAQTVKAVGADFGVAVDPDADRLVLIDNNGNPIGEEKTIAVAVESYLSTSGKKGIVVVNLSTSSMTEIIAKKYDCNTLRAPVGEINVVKLMKVNDAIIGGEGSGGVILPECHYGRDSLVGIALTLNLLATRNQTLSEIAEEMPKLKMIKHKKSFQGDIREIFGKIQQKYSDAKITLSDGIRIDYDDKWVQLRASNTEPIVRIIAEAQSIDLADNLVNEVLSFID